MEIYNWEIAVKEHFMSVSQTDTAFKVMHWVSYPGAIGWAMWLFLLFLIIRKDFKNYWPIVLLALLAAGVGDLISRQVLKEIIMRPRPLFDVAECITPKCWGFVSSHCTNVAAFATVMSLFRKRNLLWAIPAVAVVSVSRLYILDHYPLDVIGGCALGVMIGVFLWCFTKIVLKIRKDSLATVLKSRLFKITSLGVVLIFLTSWILYVSIFRMSKNLYSVEEGKFYRSAQLNAVELEQVIKEKGIKTVINLRGAPENSFWYKPEKALLGKMNVNFQTYWLSTDHFPTREELNGILDNFQNAEKPILIHCRSGADRTGMISALYVLDQMKGDKVTALEQLRFKFWHVRSFHPAMSKFIEVYQGRDWATEYDPCKYPDFVRNKDECT